MAFYIRRINFYYIYIALLFTQPFIRFLLRANSSDTCHNKHFVAKKIIDGFWSFGYLYLFGTFGLEHI